VEVPVTIELKYGLVEVAVDIDGILVAESVGVMDDDGELETWGVEVA